jgi:hypothetical protein
MTIDHRMISKGNGSEQLFEEHIVLQCRLLENENQIAKHAHALGRITDEQAQALASERCDRALAIEAQWKSWTEAQQ